MTNLFPPPPIYDLPLVKGQDLVVNFRNKVPNSNPVEYTTYPDGVVVQLVIDADTPVVSDAVIDAENATCRIESTVTDPLKKGLLWRCRVTLPGSPATDRVPVNGVTVRFDGK